MREKIFSVLTTPALNEYVMLEVLSAGRWRKQLDRLNAKLSAARQVSARLLTQAGIVLDHPGEGGLFLWGRVPGDVDVGLLVQDAYQNNILLARGSTFSATRHYDSYIRFNAVISQSPEVSAYLVDRLQTLAQGREVLKRAHTMAHSGTKRRS
jgi:DNA-binding transcriptional MocR family regulator